MFAASKTASVSGGYQISRSLRFNSADSAYLNRTPASAGNRRTYTWSGWVKRSSIGTGDRRLFEAGVSSSNVFWFGFGNDSSTDQFLIQDYSGGFGIQLATTALYRDPSAWYHVVVAIDTTQATSTDRVKLYLNGVQVTSFSTATYPSQNYDTRTNQTVVHDLGGSTVIGGSAYYNGYITEVNFIDGTQLTPSSFGETNAQTGVWTPKAYSGSYGTNGFYLNFSDNSNTTAATLGKDYSGNGNNWTPNNFSVTAGAGNDSLVDSPTSYGTTDTGVGGEIRGNYCTMNPLDKSSNITFSNGNLDGTASTGWALGRATFGMSSGKWYWEVVMTSGIYLITGIAKQSATLSGYLGSDANGWGYYSADGNKYNNGSNSAYGATWGANAVIGVAFDADAGTLTFYKNGTSQGTAYTGLTSGPYFPATSIDTSVFITTNFGQRPFAYTAPSGYKALCTQNLPTPTIGATSTTLATSYFNPITYSGDSVSGRTLTGVGFQPDFVWLKQRSGSEFHNLTDAVRGASKTLFSNSTAAEQTNRVWGYVSAFASDGFTVTSGGGGIGEVNASGTTYVAWNWKANGSGSTNTAGSITSTVSANTTSGFSVVTWTGNSSNATIGHGLGVAPSMVIIKYRGTTDNWYVYNSNVGTNKYLVLNATDAAATSTSIWQNTAPTSTVFSIGGGNNNSTIVAYCFAEVAGYSKFGSYTGNGSTDGVFVYTGFRPAFVLIKQSSGGGGHWSLKDSARSPSNVALANLFPNLSNAETSEYDYDILSNGFKLRTTSITVNASGETYIFAAFASNPFKYSLAR